MKKVYIGAAVAIVYAAVIGVVGPLLVSTKHDVAFLLGLVVLLVAVLAPVHVLYNKFNSKKETNDE